MPIFGFPKMGAAAYYLTRIDSAAPPKTISLPHGAMSVHGGLLELHDERTNYLWSFYSAGGPISGVTTILAGSAVPRADDRVDLLVGNEPARVLAIANMESGGAQARVITTDQPALGANNMGAHEFLFARCP